MTHPAYVECRHAVEGEDGKRLLAHEIRRWLDSVPDDAVVSPVVRDFGSQRDPNPTLVGLRARWTEER